MSLKSEYAAHPYFPAKASALSLSASTTATSSASLSQNKSLHGATKITNTNNTYFKDKNPPFTLPNPLLKGGENYVYASLRRGLGRVIYVIPSHRIADPLYLFKFFQRLA
jgi:hypothetical protein